MATSPFIDIRNFRSLSSAGKVNGMSLVDHRFYRCASLYHASKESLEVLYRDYRVRLIIDVRTKEEVESKPDPEIKGVKHLHIPVMAESNNGVNRHGEQRPSYVERVADYQELEETYKKLGSDPYSLKQFGKVIKACLDLKEGAVLWHCSAGKDRTGMVAYLLLTLFGYPKKLIFNDYLLTNGEAKRFAWKMGYKAYRTTHNRKLAHKVWRMSVANKRYLEAFDKAIMDSCGSLNGFFKDYCGLSKEDIESYRSQYLTARKDSF